MQLTDAQARAAECGLLVIPVKPQPKNRSRDFPWSEWEWKGIRRTNGRTGLVELLQWESPIQPGDRRELPGGTFVVESVEANRREDCVKNVIIKLGHADVLNPFDDDAWLWLYRGRWEPGGGLPL